MLVGYTLSKSEDNGSGIRVLTGDALFPQNSNCFECEWGLSIFDVRHRLVTSVLYELPFGPGKPFLKDGSAAPFSAAGRSARSSTSRAASRGTRRSATISPTPASQTYRPNVVAGQDPNDGPKTPQQWFNTAAFARPGAFTYGNAGRKS